jgi:hypothetical protein
MTISEDEGATAPSTDVKPSNTPPSAEIVAFKNADIRTARKVTEPSQTAQQLSQNNTDEAYAERLQARELSILDVFILGMLIGGLLVYIAVSRYDGDRYVGAPHIWHGIRDRSPAAMQFDLERPWPSSREADAP